MPSKDRDPRILDHVAAWNFGDGGYFYFCSLLPHPTKFHADEAGGGEWQVQHCEKCGAALDWTMFDRWPYVQDE